VTAALELAERALAAAPVGEAVAVVRAERSGFARYAASELHQPTLVEDVSLTLAVAWDGRSGTASTNGTSDGALREVAARAAEAAACATPDPELPPPASPATYPEVDAYDVETAELSPGSLAELARAAIGGAAGIGLYGYCTAGACELGIAATTGLRASQAFTDATCVALAAAPGASGYAERTAWRVAAVDPAAAGREAAEKAARTTGAGRLEPGRYRALLEPYAVAELLHYFSFDTLGGLGLLEERSFFSGRVGERAFDPRISLADDPLDPRGLPKAFDFEGVPRQRVSLVEQGIVRGVVWDQRTGFRAGRESTGHAVEPEASASGPLPLALSLAPGEAGSTDELAEAVGDGIYVTRLHYLSVVDPRRGVITGTTRDGTFRIRGGRIGAPLVNLRFTVAVPDLLADVPALAREVALVNQSDFYDMRSPYAYLVPALATASFNVTGTGSDPGL
jgi:predicted Zn-dependent protease